MTKYRLKLFITRHTPKSDRAIKTLRDLCDHHLNGQCELSIIDVQENPELADDEKVLATPTLIRELPPPVLRIIGDLSDSEKILAGLDLQTLRR